jgi:hypothetical protein
LIASQSSSCSNSVYETELLLSRPPDSQFNVDMVFAFAPSKRIHWMSLGLFVALAVAMSVQLSWSVSSGVPYKSPGEWPVPFPTHTVDSEPSSGRIDGKVQNASSHPATPEESEDRENQKEQLLSVGEAPSSSRIQWEGRNYSSHPLTPEESEYLDYQKQQLPAEYSEITSAVCHRTLHGNLTMDRVFSIITVSWLLITFRLVPSPHCSNTTL